MLFLCVGANDWIFSEKTIFGRSVFTAWKSSGNCSRVAGILQVFIFCANFALYYVILPLLSNLSAIAISGLKEKLLFLFMCLCLLHRHHFIMLWECLRLPSSFQYQHKHKHKHNKVKISTWRPLRHWPRHQHPRQRNCYHILSPIIHHVTPVPVLEILVLS